MQARNVLRKATELGIGIVAIATMILAGCGGGGSGSATCSATGTVSGAEAVNCMFAETSANWDADLAGMPNWAGTSSAIARASTYNFVATGTNTYTYKSSLMDLATSSASWSTGTYVTSYYLAATGWQRYDIDTAASYTNNGDSTISSTLIPWGQAEVTSITRTDLSGQPVACTNPLGSDFVGENIGSASNPVIVTAASCPVAVTYPSGSASYTTTVNFTDDETYFLVDDPTHSSLTDGTGVALTALPSTDARFCINGRVYDPIPGAAAGADNYTEHYNYPFGTCSVADINNALNNGFSHNALISLKTTGNAAVPTVFIIKTTYGTESNEAIYVFHLGRLMSGSYSPASTSTSTSTDINKTAANAQLRANGLPPLP